MDLVIGAEAQCFEQGRRHAPVMTSVGLASFQLNLLLVRTFCLVFGHNLLQRFFAGHRIDDFVNNTIRLGNGDFGDFVQNTTFAPNSFDVAQDFALHSLFSVVTDTLDDAQEQIYQVVGNLLTA